jgi:hypothetical protein
MSRLTLLAALLVTGGCTADRPDVVSADVERAILQRTEHKLAWDGYDGTGDPETAFFTLDQQPLGEGREGVAQLRRLIAKMPKGSKVLVMPYYGDPGSGRKLKYPFDTQELYSHCSRHDVILGIQKAG